MTFSGLRPKCSTTFATPAAFEPEIGTTSDECSCQRTIRKVDAKLSGKVRSSP